MLDAAEEEGALALLPDVQENTQEEEDFKVLRVEMSARRKRVITLKFASASEAAEFLQYALARVGNLAAEQSGPSLKLILLAPPVKSEEDYRKLIALLKEWRTSRQAPRKGFFRHSIGLLLASANLKVSIPLAALADTLTLMGYRARVDGGHLVTNAPFKRAVEVAETFSAKYSEALETPAAPLARRLAAVLATALDLTVEEAFEKLQRLGIVKVDEESGKYVLSVNYEESLKRLSNLDSSREAR
ncbi:MAG: DUF2067 family protein [Thermofilaceae archaeon]